MEFHLEVELDFMNYYVWISRSAGLGLLNRDTLQGLGRRQILGPTVLSEKKL